MNRTRLAAALAVCALLLVGACSSGEAGSTSFSPSTSVPPEPSTTVGSEPESVASSSTTSTMGGFAVSDPLGLTPPDPLPGGGGAAGSGCTPGSTVLPDGVWFGYLATKGATRIELDLACVYFGDVAWEKAGELGEEANNDYWIENTNPAVRSVAVGDSARAWVITGDPTEGLQPVAFDSDWNAVSTLGFECPGPTCGVWVYVNGGVATEILEQYLP